MLPLIDLFTLWGRCNSVERRGGSVVFCWGGWEDQSRSHLPFLFHMVLGNGSRKLDFSCVMESGSSKQRHLAATQSKSGRLQLPKSSFNSLKHESRRSIFQMEPRDAGSSWFFMPALTGFTVKEGIFFIKSNFLPYFFTNLLPGSEVKRERLPHPHTWTTGNPLKQSEFESTDVSTACSLFRRPCSVSAVSDPHAGATDRFGVDEMKESSDCLPTLIWFWNVHPNKVI